MLISVAAYFDVKSAAERGQIPQTSKQTDAHFSSSSVKSPFYALSVIPNALFTSVSCRSCHVLTWWGDFHCSGITVSQTHQLPERKKNNNNKKHQCDVSRRYLLHHSSLVLLALTIVLALWSVVLNLERELWTGLLCWLVYWLLMRRVRAFSTCQLYHLHDSSGRSNSSVFRDRKLTGSSTAVWLCPGVDADQYEGWACFLWSLGEKVLLCWYAKAICTL